MAAHLVEDRAPVSEAMSDLPPMQLGSSPHRAASQLVAAVLAGEKTATAGLLAEYEAEGEPLPDVGGRFLLLDYDDEPVAVVETVELRVLRAGDVDLAFARDEGEASPPSRTGARRTSRSGRAG